MWADVARVFGGVGLGETGERCVRGAEDLEGFKEGGEGDLEVGEIGSGCFCVGGVVRGRLGGWEGAVESCEKGFVEKNDALVDVRKISCA